MARLADSSRWLVRQAISHATVPGQYVAADLAGRVMGRAKYFAEAEIGGHKIALDLNDEIQRQVYFGIYERQVTRLLRQLLQPGDVFYDVGANVGYFSFLASGIVGSTGEVHSFEPVPVNSGRIRQNISRADASNIVINEVAISDRSGAITLFVSDSSSNSGWASVVPSSRRPQKLIVSTISLDDYVFSKGRRLPDIIKMDIEGNEPTALAGMRRILSSECAPDLIVEVNPYLLSKRGLTPETILRTLTAAGYRLYRIGGHRLVPLADQVKLTDLQDVLATKHLERSDDIPMRQPQERT